MDGVYQLVIGGVNTQGQYAQSVLHFNVTGTSSEDSYVTAKDVATSVFTALSANWLAALSQDITINLVYAKLVSGAGGPTVFFPTLASGTQGIDPLSNALAVDIVFFPGGARNRPGHLYWWGTKATGLIGDAIQSGLIGLLTTICNQLTAAIALALGSARYGTYTRSSKTCTPASHFEVRPKLTGFTKRTLPLT